MSQILVRDLAPEIVERLKERARGNARSLEAEVRVILEDATRRYTMAEFAEVAAAWRKRLAGRAHSDSAVLTREDRDADHGHDS